MIHDLALAWGCALLAVGLFFFALRWALALHFRNGELLAAIERSHEAEVALGAECCRLEGRVAELEAQEPAGEPVPIGLSEVPVFRLADMRRRRAVIEDGVRLGYLDPGELNALPPAVKRRLTFRPRDAGEGS